MNQPQPEAISLADFLVWEEQQPSRHEWVDGIVVPRMGVSFEHAQIATNLVVLLAPAVSGGSCFIQLSDRRLVPRDDRGEDLGSFYADLFVSCASADRSGGAAHYPTVVVEILSNHVGDEFTRKKTAYLGSRDIRDYVIVDSTRRSAFRYSWQKGSEAPRLLKLTEYQRGPVRIPSLDLTIGFDQIYDQTAVRAILHPIETAEELPTRIDFA